MEKIEKGISGVYCIENIIDGKKYIGYAQDIAVRWNTHILSLGKKKHNNKYLQHSWDKYGASMFNFRIVQVLENIESLLQDMEIYWIAYYNSYIYDLGGYNLTRGGEGIRGYKYTDEQRLAVSDRMKGKIITEEQKLKISIANKGKKRTDETKAKMSKSFKGHFVSEETRRKQSEMRKGRVFSEESILNYQYASSGRKSNRETSSKYVGVTWDKSRNKWVASFCGKHLGRFSTEEDAAIAYNNASIEKYGDRAKLNIIVYDVTEGRIDE
jgi:group I intron endonuclease